MDRGQTTEFPSNSSLLRIPKAVIDRLCQLKQQELLLRQLTSVLFKFDILKD